MTSTANDDAYAVRPGFNNPHYSNHGPYRHFPEEADPLMIVNALAGRALPVAMATGSQST
jgi:dTDP-D-glucose 4,6-dehydratase